VDLYVNKKAKTDKESSLIVLKSVLPVLSGVENWKREEIHEALVSQAAALGVKNALLLWPVRIAVSGRSVAPGGVDDICALLGRDETLRRIGRGISKLEASV
jgi:glutamyl-tRNA synthetase